MISVANYETKYDEDKQVSYIDAIGALICPACDSFELIKKGWRRRQLILLIGTLMVLMVRRVKCKKCNRIHHVLPDIVVPYKRHDAETINKILEGDPKETLCEESTINRFKLWWTSIKLYVLTVAVSVIEKRKIYIAPELSFKETVRVLVNAHLWPG